MSYLTSLYESIDAVPSGEWDAVCAAQGDPFMDRRFLAAVERSMAAESKFYYVIFRDASGRAMACAALSLYSIDGALFVGRGLKRFIQIARRLWSRYLKFKILFCGLPVSAGQKHLTLDPAADADAVTAALDEVLCRLARREGAWLVVAKEFEERDKPQLQSLTDRGYLLADSLPMNHFEPRFRDLDEFCGALRSHYRYKINKSLRKFDQAGLRVERLVDADQILRLYTDDVHRLYEAVVERAEHKLEVLPAEFFRELTRRMPGQVSLTAIFDGERVVGFNWELLHDRVFYNLFIGIDYSVKPEADLYFNTMLHGIDSGLRTGASDIQVGQTAEDFKSRIGCHLQPRYLYVKSVNRPLHWILRSMTRVFFPPPPKAPERDLFKPAEAVSGAESAAAAGSESGLELRRRGRP